MSLSPDATRMGVGLTSGKVSIWSNSDVATTLEADTLPGEPSIAFSPDGRRLAAGGGKQIKIWDTETGRLLPHLSDLDRDVTTISFNADGRLLFCGCDDGAVRVFEAETGGIFTQTLEPGKRIKGDSRPRGAIKTIRPTSDGKRVLIGTPHVIEIWRTFSSEEINQR